MRERLARLAVRFGPPLGVGAVLGLIGPFGTFDMLPPGRRLAYWLAVVSANWLLADALIRQVHGLAAGHWPLPGLTVPLAGAALASVPATGVVTLANGLSGIGWPGNIAVLFAQVLLLLAAIALPVYAWEATKARAIAPSDPGAPSDPAEPAECGGLRLFTARLPRPLEGRLVCLEMQDHYLVVHHSAGSEMVLCRMEDAARELSDVGRRVHRSWWVAADAVEAVERDGQRVLLRLTTGRRVPVGRSFRPDLKAAGWL
jgi:hypothetical protein